MSYETIWEHMGKPKVNNIPKGEKYAFLEVTNEGAPIPKDYEVQLAKALSWEKYRDMVKEKFLKTRTVQFSKKSFYETYKGSLTEDNEAYGRLGYYYQATEWNLRNHIDTYCKPCQLSWDDCMFPDKESRLPKDPIQTSVID